MPRTELPVSIVPKRLTRKQLRTLNDQGITPIYPFDLEPTVGTLLREFIVDGVGRFYLAMVTVTRDGHTYEEPSERILDALMVAAVEGIALSTVYDYSHRQVLVGKIETPETRAEQEGAKVTYIDRDRASKIRVRTEPFMADLHERTQASGKAEYCPFCGTAVPPNHDCPNRRRTA